MDVSGYALVTGAASGIGKETAKTFGRDGAAGVALLDMNAPMLEKAKVEVEEAAGQTTSGRKGVFRVLTFKVDVRDEKEVEKVVNDVAREFGRIDYLVNCAGMAFRHEEGSAKAQTEDWKRVLDVNLSGTFYMVRAATTVMLKQDPIRSEINGRSLQRGSIVNIASVMGVVGIATGVSYCASKHGVIGLTRSVSEDYAKDGLRINAVCPGYVETPMTQTKPEFRKSFEDRVKTMTPMQRPGQPQELADAIVFLCGGRSSFMTGSVVAVDGGYTQR